MTTPVHAFLQGAGYLPRAARLLADRPELRRFIWSPIALGLVAGALLYLALFAAASGLVGWLMLHLPVWANPLGVVLNVVLLGVLLWVAGVVVAKFGVILGSPWYGQLAEAIERSELPAGEVPDAPRGLAAFVGDIALALGYEVKKLVLVLGIGLPALLLNLVPGPGNLAATAVWTGLGATTLALDFLDPALQRRRLRFRAKLRVVLADAPAAAGLGLPALFLTGIPVVNLLTVPVCMAAGALFYAERVHKRL